MERGRTHKTRVILCGSCPHCGESVEMELSKREIKGIARGFHMSQTTAQLLSEKRILMKYETETKENQLRDALSRAAFTAEEQQVIDRALHTLEGKTR